MEDIDLLALEVPVVVTAGRHEEPLTSVPAAMSVITAEDIRAAGAQSVPDALRLAAGVDVADLGSAAWAVSPRGFHGLLSNQTLVLVDGRQIFDSLFGGTVWGSWPFQVEDIERIEVIRGPGGVAWGANAMNGVINIITKDPADTPGLSLTAGGGSRGRHKERMGYSFREGKLRMRVSGEYEAHDGFRRGGSLLRRLDDGHKTGRSSVYGVYDLTETESFVFSLGNGLVDGSLPPTPQAGFGLRRHSQSQASHAMAEYRKRMEKDNELSLRAYVNDFQISPGVPSIDYRYQQIAVQIGHHFKPAEEHTLTWGIDSRNDLLDATNSDPYMLEKSFVASGVFGAYVQDEWRFAPKWTAHLGGRVDYDYYGGFQPSGRAALSYDLDRSSMLYGSLSRAFHMPPAAARFLDIPLLNGLAHVVSDRDVDPDSLLAYELGHRAHWLDDRLETNAALFWHSLNDVTTLAPQPGPPGLIRVLNDNRGRAEMYGAELDVRYRVSGPLTLLGNYTFQNMIWNGEGPYVQEDAISPPQHKFMIGARYGLTKSLHLSGHVYYVDDVQAPNPAFPFVAQNLTTISGSICGPGTTCRTTAAASRWACGTCSTRIIRKARRSSSTTRKWSAWCMPRYGLRSAKTCRRGRQHSPV